MLLELNHGTSTAKAVKMLYHVLHILPKQQRDRMVLEILMPENFYRFLFHWSCFVRNAFAHFYYFQLHRLLIEEDNKEVIQKSIHGAMKKVGESESNEQLPTMVN